MRVVRRDFEQVGFLSGERSVAKGACCIGKLRSDERAGIYPKFEMYPRFVQEQRPLCGRRVGYRSRMWTRSPSAVVAYPGSVTMSWIVFPDRATIICRCTGGWLPLVTVKVPVQSGLTE